MYRNERRLGTVWTGLAGRELCWFASVNMGSAVRVKGGAPPAGWYGTGVLAKVRMASACEASPTGGIADEVRF